VRVVAVTALSGDLDVEVAPIAALVGLSAYDVRARLAGGLPRLLLSTADREFADRVARGMAARGHAVTEIDPSEATTSAQMVKLSRFAFDASGVWANDGVGDHLAWGDLAVVVVALVRSEVARTTQELEHPGSTDGSSRAMTRDVTKTEHSVSHVAYLFPRRDGRSGVPWLLEEATAQFRGLGPAMQPTRRANFLATVARVRQLAPHAVVDDRFVSHPRTAAVVVHVRGGETAAPVPAGADVDLLVHILASSLMARRGGPYRG
jgi:hypothetical protein